MSAKRIPLAATRPARGGQAPTHARRGTLAYYCAATTGGIMEYAVCQASALAEAGVEVQFLCRPEFPVWRLRGVTPRPDLASAQALRGATRLTRWLARLRDARRGARAWVRLVGEDRRRRGLDACYHEYLAPFWTGPLRRLAGSGAIFGTVAHDPVRDFVVGPRWWHRRSVAAGYSFVRDVFVHDETPVDTGRPASHLRTHIIPMGPLASPAPRRLREDMREELGVLPGEVLFLSFGHIRDNKNLDLFLKAMARLPDHVKLVVAGNENARSQKPAAHYQKLAHTLCLGHRCRWFVRYLPGEEAADLFEAADFCLLTYAGTFVSASGVLNSARQYRRPCLASDGGGPLGKVVQRYGLGLWVPPDNLSHLVEGVTALLAQPPQPDWDAFERENSWERNAELVTAALFGERPPPAPTKKPWR